MVKRNGLTLLAGLAAAVPVLVAGGRAVADGWLPVADQGRIASSAYEVFTSHTPLVGPYSLASLVIGRTVHDLGPLLYWLVALPARFGGPAAITLTMTAFNAVAIVGSVWLARRRGGTALMLLAAIAIALMCRSFGSEALHGIFNPAAALFGLLLLCFVCWSLACGDRWMLPLAALLASFVVQCHLGYVAPALGLLAIGVIGLFVSRHQPADVRGEGAQRVRAGGGTLWRPALATFVVAVVCWTPPVVDQITHSPGNLGVVVSATGARGRTEGAAVGWRVLARAVGIPPRWLRAPERAAVDPRGNQLGPFSGGDYGDTRLRDVWRPLSALGTVTALLVLGALAFAILAALRLRRRDVVAAAAIGAVLCASFAVLASATPARSVDSLGYTLWWGSLVGMWTWLVVAWSYASLARSWTSRRGALPSPGSARLIRYVRRGSLAAATAALLAAGVSVALGQRADAHQPEFAALRTISARLDRRVHRGTAVLLTQRGFAVLPLAPFVKYSLRRHGVHVVGYEGRTRIGPAYELRRGRYDLAVEVTEARRPGLAHAAVLARVRLPAAPWLPGAGTARVITVAVAIHARRTTRRGAALSARSQ